MDRFNEILESRTSMALKYSDVADVDSLRPTEAAADIASLLQSVTGTLNRFFCLFAPPPPLPPLPLSMFFVRHSVQLAPPPPSFFPELSCLRSSKQVLFFFPFLYLSPIYLATMYSFHSV